MSTDAPQSASQPAGIRGGMALDDIVLIPLAAALVALKRLTRALIILLVRLIDFLFPILLQVMRFPLFTLRMIGDGLTRLMQAIVAILPLGGDKKRAWREALARGWAWLRAKISYKAFEEAVHHAFEAGMAWVFRTCKTLSPSTALLVIVAAVLWIPISFGAATAVHALLIAKAAVLPPWMQLFHGVATILAKSKLLVLPVYPAAWPQARKHPLVEAIAAICRRIAALPIAARLGLRYRQSDEAAIAAIHATRRAGRATGATRALHGLRDALWRLVDAAASGLRVALRWLVKRLARLPVLGPVVARYAIEYRRTHEPHAETLSTRTRSFFQRWSVKFTAGYYEAREAAAGTPGHGGGHGG